MRRFASVNIVLATVLLCLSEALSYDEPKHISRRAIDGSRGRKYFDPKEDGYYDDFGYDKGHYHGYNEDNEFSDLRSNVPGEPGVDYPALVKIPRTSFSCYGRDHGYYADEETGCQVFHLCDSGYATSFLCPIGSLFSQRLLTCDWWTKVPCTQSHEFYTHQQQQQIQPQQQQQKDDMMHDQDSQLTSSILVHANQLEPSDKVKHPRSRVQTKHTYFKDEALEKKASVDSPLIRIKPLVVQEKRARGFSTSKSPVRKTTSWKVTSTEPSVEKITEGSLLSSAFVKEDNQAITSTARPFEASPASFEEENVSTSTAASYEPTLSSEQQETASTEKKSLDEENITEIKIENNLENEDMEPKESISLVKSHAERKLEKEEEQASTTQQVVEDKAEVTTVPAIMETTAQEVAEAEVTTFPPQLEENVKPNESINEIQPQVEENEAVTDILKTEAKQVVEESVKSSEEEKEVVATTEHVEIEKSMLKPSVEESSEETTEAVVTNVSVESEEVQTTLAPEKPEVHTTSNFLIKVPEHEVIDYVIYQPGPFGAPKSEESSPSSEVSSESTDAPAATQTSEEQSTFSPTEAPKATDAAEESNDPLHVTVSLNAGTYVSNEQNPVVFTNTKHQTHPFDVDNLAVVSSDRHEDLSPDQNQLQSSPTPIVRTYQNIRFHYNQDDSQPQIIHPVSTTRTQAPIVHPVLTTRTQAPIVHPVLTTRTQAPIIHPVITTRTQPPVIHPVFTTRAQPTISTTFRNYQEPTVSTTTEASYEELTSPQSFQSIPVGSANEHYQEDYVDANVHQIVSSTSTPTTTQASSPRYNNQNDQYYEPRGFRNQQRQRQRGRYNYQRANHISESPVASTTTSTTYVSEDVVSVEIDQNKPSTPNYTIRPRSKDGRTRNHYQTRGRQDNNRGRYVNYQTHNYPEITPTSQPKQQESTFENYPSNFNVYQTTATHSPKPVPSTERPRSVVSTQKTEDYNNYDYQHYENAEDLEANLFEDFGAKISSRKQQRNKPANSVTESPKVRAATRLQ